MAKTIAYRRVSSIDQKTDRQLDGMTFDKEFEDKLSGKDTNRPQLKAMLGYIRDGEGDHVYVHELSRLGRSVIDLHSLVKAILDKGASITFVKDKVTYEPGEDDDPMKNAMFGMLSVFAKFERDLIKVRQKEGIAAARAKGKHLGRPAKLKSDDVLSVIEKHKAGMNPTDLAREFGVSRASIYNIVKNS